MPDLVILGIVGVGLFFAGRKTWRDMRQSRCSGCSQNCSAKPMPIQINTKLNK